MRRGLVTGFAGWIIAITVFRLFGHQFFSSTNAFVATFVLGGLAAAALAALSCRLICTPGKVARFAAGVVIPGLLLGSASVVAFDVAFPGIPIQFSAVFAALVLWSYGLTLSTIVLFGDRLVKPI